MLELKPTRQPGVPDDVQAAIDALDILSVQMRTASDALNVIWRRGGHNLASIRAMRAAGKRARSAAR